MSNGHNEQIVYNLLAKFFESQINTRQGNPILRYVLLRSDRDLNKRNILIHVERLLRTSSH